jgi:hypothetical protein
VPPYEANETAATPHGREDVGQVGGRKHRDRAVIGEERAQ